MMCVPPDGASALARSNNVLAVSSMDLGHGERETKSMKQSDQPLCVLMSTQRVS